jgi:uncharacterized protein (DUF849 family)
MPNPCIISVAITGSVPRKKDNPAVPITTAEQIESTHEAYEAGASLVHVHVRNPDESSSSDPALFAAFQEGVRKHCPDMIVQFSTGGRGREMNARGSMLHLKPDMASLATGSVNFPTIIYENAPDFIRSLAQTMKDNGVIPEIEVFDLAMLYSAAKLSAEGLIPAKPHIQFVFGIKNALPADRDVLEFQLKKLRSLIPGATWTAAGIGRDQLTAARWSLELGGHCRTGLEDNIRLDRDRLAPSNASLVRQVVDLAATFNRPIATPTQARQILGLQRTGSAARLLAEAVG